MSIKFLVLGGGVFWVWGGGGGADFIFLGARIFLSKGSTLCHSPLGRIKQVIVANSGTET